MLTKRTTVISMRRTSRKRIHPGIAVDVTPEVVTEGEEEESSDLIESKMTLAALPSNRRRVTSMTANEERESSLPDEADTMSDVCFGGTSSGCKVLNERRPVKG